MVARRIAALAAPLLGLAFSGCITFTGDYGTRVLAEDLARIEDGVTTRAQILMWFGPPSAFFNPTILDIIREDEEQITTPAPVLNDVFTYRYIENDTKIVFVPIVFGIIDAAATYETLTIFFDEQGRVEYHAFRRDEARPRETN